MRVASFLNGSGSTDFDIMPSSLLSPSTTAFPHLAAMEMASKRTSSAAGGHFLPSLNGRENGVELQQQQQQQQQEAKRKLGEIIIDEQQQESNRSGADSNKNNNKNSHSSNNNNIMEGGGGTSGGEEQDQPTDQANMTNAQKKRYHRHSVFQIQQMEAFFKECPHPDEKQRQELGRALKLSPRQVKFWFQNRRTQMKAQHERSENSQLRNENEKLRIENITMREAIKHATCPTCGGIGEPPCDEHQLRLENVRLRDELQRVSAVAARYFGRPVPSLVAAAAAMVPAPMMMGGSPSAMDNMAGASSSLQQQQMLYPPQGVGSGLHGSGPNSMAASSTCMSGVGAASFGEAVPGPSVAEVALRPGGLSELEKPMVVDLAVAALDELLRMFHADEPLWLKSPAVSPNVVHDAAPDVLNLDEYLRQLAGGVAGPRPFGLTTEASRDTGLVIMNSTTLVEALMDANKWTDMFPSIVAKAATVEILSPGVGSSRDGALQLMYAELQVMSPLMQTREVYFLRYCKQVGDKVWAVVDVSVDSLRENPPPSLLLCRRKPSGCLIQDMPSGYSQVTWLEHVETDDRAVHPLFRGIVSSGLAFGARRWLATLQRHCESLVSLLATNISPRDLGVIQTPEGRRAILRLAHKMCRRFCTTISASTCNTWITLDHTGGGAATGGGGEEDVRIMMRDNPGDGVLLCAATTTWLPFSRHQVFDFLRDEHNRGEWDVLANGAMDKMYHIAEGQHPGNNVSLLRPTGSNPTQSNVIFLQESCTDASGSLIVYAPVDYSTLNMVLQGEDPSHVMPPPSGFVILPDSLENGPTGLLLPDLDSQSSGGSLLTVSIQIAVNHIPSSGKLNLESVNTISSIIINTVQHIKVALQRANA